MAVTAGGLNIAILKRLRGTEVLTGEHVAPQAVLSAIQWRLGTLTQQAEIPCGRFYEDAAIDANQGRVGVGVQRWAVRRFELWTESTDESFVQNAANALEMCFDTDRGAPVLSVTGDGRIWEHGLLTDLQYPLYDPGLRAYYGLLSFQFLESRP